MACTAHFHTTCIGAWNSHEECICIGNACIFNEKNVTFFLLVWKSENLCNVISSIFTFFSTYLLVANLKCSYMYKTHKFIDNIKFSYRLYQFNSVFPNKVANTDCLDRGKWLNTRLIWIILPLTQIRQYCLERKWVLKVKLPLIAFPFKSRSNEQGVK